MFWRLLFFLFIIRYFQFPSSKILILHSSFFIRHNDSYPSFSFLLDLFFSLLLTNLFLYLF
ncbi:hypothetical protein IC582_002064 [Cucumis melo]